jgi:hypothetical protein
MAITFIGNTQLSRVFKGNTEIKKIYKGATTLFSSFPSSFRYLIVAGGGGGGMDMGGGGGAGGFISGNTTLTQGTPYSIIVGAGGTGGPAAGTNGQPSAHPYTIPATNGGNSSFNSLTAIGGGFGGSSYRGYTPGITGGNGGSGGGASGYNDNAGTFYGGTATAGQGNVGGNSTAAYYSGGGGGAGGAGVSSTAVPHGGIGIQDDILGTAYYWAGGGGGSAYSVSPGGNGGAGGGGGGAVGTTTGGSGLNAGSAGGGGSINSWTNTPGGNAGANTGGGGGGGSHYNANNKGGDGGSGIVAIRYPGAQVFTGGTITTVGGDTVHTFTSSGTLLPLGQQLPIPTDGLQLQLEASNSTSYPGSGNTWYDLSGNSRNFTLDGSGIAWNAGGWFDLSNGGGSYTGGAITNTTTGTLALWIQTTDEQALFWSDDNSQNYIGAYRVGNKEYYGEVGSPTYYQDLTEKTNIYDNIRTGNWIFVEFKNVNFSANGANSYFNKYSDYTFSSTKVGAYYIYSKNLSTEESTQLYNATKGQYGL